MDLSEDVNGKMKKDFSCFLAGKGENEYMNEVYMIIFKDERGKPEEIIVQGKSLPDEIQRRLDYGHLILGVVRVSV